MKAEVLKLELLGNTNLVLVIVCCAVCPLRQPSSFPCFPWLFPAAAGCLTHREEQLWGQDSLSLLLCMLILEGVKEQSGQGSISHESLFSPMLASLLLDMYWTFTLKIIYWIYQLSGNMYLFHSVVLRMTYWASNPAFIPCKTLPPWVVSRRTLRFVREAVCCSLWVKLRSLP